MRYLLIVAVLAVLGGGVLLFATGEDRTGQATRSTVTETSGGGGAEVVVAPRKDLPAAPQVADDTITGARPSATAHGEAGQDATPTPADAGVVTAAFEDDDEIERRSLAGLQEDDTIERRPLALRAPADHQGPTADGAEAPPIVASRAPDRAVARAPADRQQTSVANGLGRDEGAQIAASEVVKAPQTPQAVAPRAPEQAVARAPAERRQALIANGLGRDEGAQVVASEVVKAPQTPQAVAPRAPEQAVARAPADRQQTLVANGLGRDEGAQVAASEVVKAPQTPQAVAPRAPDHAVARASAERQQTLVANGLGRAPNLKNRVDLDTEKAVVAYAIDYAAHGQVRVSNELRALPPVAQAESPHRRRALTELLWEVRLSAGPRRHRSEAFG